VRELGAVMERAVILGDGRRLDVARALGPVPAAPPAAAAASPAQAAPAPPGAPELSSLDAAMVRHIEAALLETRGRIEGPDGAAVLLGINPHTLRARMRKLRVDWRRFRGRRAG
jgi:DNA-binding NtrC family response regulator